MNIMIDYETEMLDSYEELSKLKDEYDIKNLDLSFPELGIRKILYENEDFKMHIEIKTNSSDFSKGCYSNCHNTISCHSNCHMEMISRREQSKYNVLTLATILKKNDTSFLNETNNPREVLGLINSIITRIKAEKIFQLKGKFNVKF